MGTGSSHGNTSLLLLLLFSVLVSKCLSLTTVEIQNAIDDDNISLDMHCRSKNNDLGQRSLFKGDSWHWDFRAIEGLTHFWCDFRWYDNLNHHWLGGTFDVYRSGFPRDKYKNELCGTDCVWSARRDGFYLYQDNTGAWQKRDDWHVVP
ncbi:S-protein homolog 2-like [Papaver somniferum]|uniref:S-protein homolog 2-like n=1 Tax=Papaver somniferum TaxID=3469 RepID=UPI000E6FA5D3|nr:S-protein homolog 2-like [Papaver somniferum]XP_026458444.1 S-protein homolog 2-like [Papaver somniferum]